MNNSRVVDSFAVAVYRVGAMEPNLPFFWLAIAGSLLGVATAWPILPWAVWHRPFGDALGWVAAIFAGVAWAMLALSTLTWLDERGERLTKEREAAMLQ